MAYPSACFLTWTCRGTWPHGDERGSVDSRNNVYQTSTLPPSEADRHRDVVQMKQPPTAPDDRARRVVADTIRDHCRIRGWDLHAVNVRTNHVHVVVACGEITPASVMRQFKAWATRRLRESGCVVRADDVWTEHGSTKYLWKPRDIADAVDYVNDYQDDVRR
jgi:REP element-mobilizing transposase RayT